MWSKGEVRAGRIDDAGVALDGDVLGVDGEGGHVMTETSDAEWCP